MWAFDHVLSRLTPLLPVLVAGSSRVVRPSTPVLLGPASPSLPGACRADSPGPEAPRGVRRRGSPARTHRPLVRRFRPPRRGSPRFLPRSVLESDSLRGRRRPDSSTVQGDLTQLSHPGLVAQTEDLNEEVSEVLSMVVAKVADGAKIRLLIGGEISKGDVSFEEPVDLPGASNACAYPKTSTFSSITG